MAVVMIAVMAKARNFSCCGGGGRGGKEEDNGGKC